MKLTPSKNAHKMAVQYLQHEFRKILPSTTDLSIVKKIDFDIRQISKTQGEGSFWNLVAAISEDWKLKSVFRMLSDSRFSWKREHIPIEKIIFTGMSPLMDEFIITKCNRNPIFFRELWKRDKKMREKIKKSGFSTHPERDHFPIFVWKNEGKYKVFDGMRRTLLAVIGNKTHIDAWVGEKKKLEGGPLVSEGFCYVLSTIYKEGGKNSLREKTFIKLGKDILKEYRNGKDVLEKRIVGWSHDKKIMSLFARILR